MSKRNITEASFPGGSGAWQKYLSEALSKHDKELSRSRKDGVCLVQFVVDTDGSISNVKALTMEVSGIGRYAVDAIKNGPNWVLAMVDGKPKKTLKVQPVVFVLAEND